MKTKKAKNDFLQSDLPSNRKEVFFDSIKLRYGLIFKIGLMMLLFSLPLLVVLFFKDSYLISIESSLSKGSISQESYNEMYKMICRIAYAVCVPCFVIFSIGLAGSLRVIRQLAWGEGVFFIQDFLDGIKANYKHYLIYSLLFGVMHYLGRMAILIDIDLTFIKVLPLIIILSVFLPVMLFGIFQSQIYTNKIWQELKNGAILYIKTFFTTFLALIIICIPIAFAFINLFFIKMLVMILYFVFVVPFILLGEFLYFNSVFDKYINKNNYPDIYGKGINNKI
ncbi:MAG: hypothetical protein J6M95_03530 [Bacilli bacterium]|nr:hypothetical protein [Bacilli bacterium]